MSHRILKDMLEAFALNGPGYVPLAATAGGTAIPDDRFIQLVAPTWGSSSNQLVLPKPDPGKIVIIAGAATGGDLRSHAPANVSINGGTGATAKSAVAANRMIVAICESPTSWKAFGIASDGTTAGLAAAS